MSPILINPTVNTSAVPKIPNVDEEKGDDTEEAREERKATGRSIAIVIFLSLMCLAIYHVIQRKTTILAGVLVPALILFTYLFFVIHVSNREKKKRKQLESSVISSIELSTPVKSPNDQRYKKISNASVTPSLSSASVSVASTSGRLQLKPVVKSDSMRVVSKMPIDPAMGVKKKPPFKKAPSQSHIQVKSIHSPQIAIENETRKLKKSRSFDRHSNLANHRNTAAVDSHKKIKTKC